MVNIYVLELEGGKYYVGKTNHTFNRFNQHWRGTGSKWTQKHSPVDLYAFHRDMRDIDENKITLSMMKEFGASNVRGGSWTKVDMTPSEIQRLNRKSRRKKKKPTCTRCGRTSHDVSTCYARFHANGKEITRKKITKKDFKPFVQSYKEERTIVINEVPEPSDEDELQELLVEIDALLKMGEENPEELHKVMEEFSEDDNAPPYPDLLSGAMYSFRNIMEDLASGVIDTVVDSTTETIRKSTKKAERVGNKILKGAKDRLGL